MDEAVRQAMARWPRVPACYGWLRLTRRGDWRIGEAAERITHAGLIDFINRNYGHEERGAWYFQNGPQRVYVTLDYTPLVYRLRNADSASFETHTGMAAQHITAAWLDDAGALIVASEHGPGVVLDRDLPALLDHLRDGNGETIGESWLADLQVGTAWIPQAPAVARLQVGERSVPVGRVRSDYVASFFGFDPAPAQASRATGNTAHVEEK